MPDEESRSLTELLTKLNTYLERANFSAYVQLLQRPLRLIWLNFIGGIARGVGIGIGFTLIAGLVLMALQRMALVNLPFIGSFIADLVRIVQAQLHMPTY